MQHAGNIAMELVQDFLQVAKISDFLSVFAFLRSQRRSYTKEKGEKYTIFDSAKES